MLIWELHHPIAILPMHIIIPMPSSSWIAFAVTYLCEAVNQLCVVHKVLLNIVFPCQVSLHSGKSTPACCRETPRLQTLGSC